MGFDFEGTYTKIIEHERIEYAFGDRQAVVTFAPQGDATSVSVTFDPESEFPVEYQQAGWQAILDNFAKRVGEVGYSK